MSRSLVKSLFAVGLACSAGLSMALDLDSAPAAAMEIVQQGRGYAILVGFAPRVEDAGAKGAVYMVARNAMGAAQYITKSGLSASPAAFYSGQFRSQMQWQLPLQDVAQYGGPEQAVCAMTFPGNHGGSVEISIGYGITNQSDVADQMGGGDSARVSSAFDRVIAMARSMGMEDKARAHEEARDRYLAARRNAQAAKLGAQNDASGSTQVLKDSWVVMDVSC